MKILIALLALSLPAAALAHAHLESSTPAKGSTLAVAPEAVILTFSEAVDLSALTLRRAGEKAARELGPLPKEYSKQLKVPLPKLADGDYTLSYVAVSTDLHEAKGSIPFKLSAAAKQAAGGASGAMDCCKGMKHDGSAQHGKAAGAPEGHGAAAPASPGAAPAPAPASGAAAHDHDHPAQPAPK